MLVQHYYPQSLSAARLDKFLANGWFRSAPMLYRSQLICLEQDVFATINIRLRLREFDYKKSLRKILRRNDKQFHYKVGPARLNRERQALYDGQKHRFKGFIFDTLEQFFFANTDINVFDTHEVSVYDGDQLIAVGFFDMGKKSIASILGLYDQRYEKYSLGTYTMLLEIKYALEQGMKYYYPGYILDKPSVFDYKLKLNDGHMEYYNWKGRWRPIDRLAEERLLVQVLREKILAMQKVMDHFKIPYERMLYPLFSVGYLVFFENNFMRSTLYLVCFPMENASEQLIVEYLLEEETYRLSWIRPCPEYQDFINMNISPDLENSGHYCLDLLRYEEVIMEDEQAFRIAHQLMRMF